MPTIFDPATADDLFRRASSLRPDAAPRWGRMDARKMLAHVSDQIRSGLGELECAPIPGPLRLPPLRWLVIHVVPWPKGKAKSPPEYLRRESTSWDDDIRRLTELIRRAVALGPGGDWAPSPVFGAISGQDWGVLVARHLDHHFRQFGA